VSAYQAFSVTRTTEPDPATLLANLRALDATAGYQHMPGSATYSLKKATAWLPAHVTAARNVLETSPAATPQFAAQADVDSFPIATRALVLALIDQLNVLRAALPAPLPPITPAAALAAIHAKAATL